MTALTLSQIKDIFLEFTECILHYILFTRKLYPLELFEKRQIYGFPTRASRHPELNDYISSFIQKLKSFEYGNKYAKVLLVIYSNNNVTERHAKGDIIEKYTISIRLEDFLDSRRETNSSNDIGLTINEIQIYLRSILLKLSTIGDRLAPFDPEKATWNLWIELNDDQLDTTSISTILKNTVNKTHDNPEKEINDMYFIPSTNQGNELVIDPLVSRLHPIKSLNLTNGNGGPSIEVFVQENSGCKTPESLGFSLTSN